MFPKIAQNTLSFLARADLKGGDVPAYVEASNMLQAIAAGQLVVGPPPKVQDETAGEKPQGNANSAE